MVFDLEAEVGGNKQFMQTAALLHRSGDRQIFPFPRTGSSHGFGDGYTEGREAVQDGRADLELGNLTVEVLREEALTHQFRYADLRCTPNTFVSTRLRR